MAFYGLTDKAARFQQALDKILSGLQGTYCFLDDIRIVTKGDRGKHVEIVEHVESRESCLQKLDFHQFFPDFSEMPNYEKEHRVTKIQH